MINQVGNKLEVKVNYKEKPHLDYILLATENDFFAGNQFEISLDEDGISTFTITLPNDFTIIEKNHITYEVRVLTASGETSITGNSYGNGEFHEKNILNYLTSFVTHFNAENYIGNKVQEDYYRKFAHLLHHIFYNNSIIDIYSDTFYKTTIHEIIESFKATPYANFDEVRKAVEQIVMSQEAMITQLQQVTSAINALYTPGDYNGIDNIRTDLVEQDFTNVQVLINQLAGNLDQQDLQEKLNDAKYYFEVVTEEVSTVANVKEAAVGLQYSFVENDLQTSSTVTWK